MLKSGENKMSKLINISDEVTKQLDRLRSKYGGEINTSYSYVIKKSLMKSHMWKGEQ
jgi:hypothetical protein